MPLYQMYIFFLLVFQCITLVIFFTYMFVTIKEYYIFLVNFKYCILRFACRHIYTYLCAVINLYVL